MFEKEAEEYRESITQRLFNEDDIESAWQRGAEFGYNKANEWHHVKEGELPKDNMIDVLALVKSNNGDLIPYIANYSHYSKEWHPDFDDEEVIEVIYWKEIILPKE